MLKDFREKYIKKVPHSTIEEAFMAGAYTVLSMSANGVDTSMEIAEYNTTKLAEMGMENITTH